MVYRSIKIWLTIVLSLIFYYNQKMDPKSDRKDEKTKLFYRRFKFKDFVHNLSFNSLVKYMYQPTDPASLGIIRFCFGK